MQSRMERVTGSFKCPHVKIASAALSTSSPPSAELIGTLRGLNLMTVGKSASGNSGFPPKTVRVCSTAHDQRDGIHVCSASRI